MGRSHTVPIPGSQTHSLDIEGGICSTALMPSSKSLIPRSGLSRDKTNPLLTVVGFSHGRSAPMPGGQPPIQDKDVSISHTVPMPSGQTPIQHVGDICPTAPMPGGQPLLPHHNLGHGNAASVLGGLPLGHTYGATSLSASMSGGHAGIVDSGVSHSLSAAIPSGQPHSLSGTCEDDEDDVLTSQELVSPFVQLIGRVRHFLQLLAPALPSSAHLTGIERAQGSALPC